MTGHGTKSVFLSRKGTTACVPVAAASEVDDTPPLSLCLLGSACPPSAAAAAGGDMEADVEADVEAGDKLLLSVCPPVPWSPPSAAAAVEADVEAAESASAAAAAEGEASAVLLATSDAAGSVAVLTASANVTELSKSVEMLLSVLSGCIELLRRISRDPLRAFDLLDASGVLPPYHGKQLV